MKIFLSYRHTEEAWVRNRLVPTLRTVGCKVLVDDEWFRAGERLRPEIAYWQDQADAHVLVLTKEYFESQWCMGEMTRALGGKVIPVVRGTCNVPAALKPLLQVRLDDPEQDDEWGKLLGACEAPGWLRAIQRTTEYLRRGQSVNLVVKGQHVWRPLIARVQRDLGSALGEVDLDRGMAVTRPGLVEQILGALGLPQSVPAEPQDIIALDRVISRLTSPGHLALLHFHRVRDRFPEQDRLDLFSSLRHLVMTERKLVLLVHSHGDFAESLPANHPLSHLDLKTVNVTSEGSTA